MREHGETSADLPVPYPGAVTKLISIAYRAQSPRG